MPARYAINAVVVLVLLIVGELMIDGGAINRYQSTVLEQVGIYIILAVSLNIATGYLASCRSATRASCRWARTAARSSSSA